MSLETVLARIAFSKALLHRDRFISDFYKQLFHNHPELRPLFPNDLSDQQVKMVDTLTLLTLHLQDREALAEGLRGLGIRHQGYGILPSHYGAMRTAMLEALRKVLGDEWTPEMASSCDKTLIWVAEVMLSATEVGSRPPD